MTDVSSDELRAAERLRAYGNEAQWDYPEAVADVLVLTIAYLAEHRPDDGEAIDANFLMAVGYQFSEHTDRWDSPEHERTGDSLCLVMSPKSTEAYYGDDDGHWVEICPPPATRGDLREFHKRLGIPLKEQST